MRHLFLLWSTTFAFILTFATLGYAADPPGMQPHIHEAFITDVRADIAIEPIEQAPPAPIRELTPAQTDPDTIWIPGYWEWDGERNDFVWVSGIWRQPPPNHLWIPGQWQEVEQNQWVWIKGFWSDVPLNQLTYLSVPPPDPMDEEAPEANSDDEFWVNGCWEYQAETESYQWRDGYWEKRDPDWILIPCHYRWRPEGYVRIEAYWDWPLEDRGAAYAPVYVAPEQRTNYVYEPKESYTTVQIIQYLFPSYPDYLTCYDYYSYYYPHYWEGYAPTPPWWGWHGWWSIGWKNHWALWWWYNNPGYPQPVWLTPGIAASLPPPPVVYGRFFVGRYRPWFITPYGVVTSSVVFRERNEFYGWRGRATYRPIVPRNRLFWDRVDRHIERQLDRREIKENLRPRGDWKEYKREHPPRAPNRVERAERQAERAKRDVVRVPNRPEVQRNAAQMQRRQLRQQEQQRQRALEVQQRRIDQRDATIKQQQRHQDRDDEQNHPQRHLDRDQRIQQRDADQHVRVPPKPHTQPQQPLNVQTTPHRRDLDDQNDNIPRMHKRNLDDQEDHIRRVPKPQVNQRALDKDDDDWQRVQRQRQRQAQEETRPWQPDRQQFQNVQQPRQQFQQPRPQPQLQQQRQEMRQNQRQMQQDNRQDLRQQRQDLRRQRNN